MWMPGHLNAGAGPKQAKHAPAAPAPPVEVYPTKYGDITQVVVPPKVYETIQALGYHHLGDLYTLGHRVIGEWALKERAPTRKESRASEHGAPATAPSWCPFCGRPRRGGRPLPSIGLRALCVRTQRRRSSGGGRQKPPRRRPYTTGDMP